MSLGPSELGGDGVRLWLEPIQHHSVGKNIPFDSLHYFARLL